MTRFETTAVLLAALLAVPLAMAQGQAPATSHDASTAAAQSADAGRSERDSATHADARNCLGFPTNLQVIMCAEKYRPHRRKA